MFRPVTLGLILGTLTLAAAVDQIVYPHCQGLFNSNTPHDQIPDVCWLYHRPDKTPLDIYKGDPCCKNCTDPCYYVLNGCNLCPEQTRDIIVTWNGKQITFVDSCTNWQQAQDICCEVYGGRLWEPESRNAYEQVRTLARAAFPNFNTACKWWIGLNNWSDDFPTAAFYASDAPDTSNPIPWMGVTDGGDGNTQNCVDIRGSGWVWGDENCKCTMLKFVCEKPIPPVNPTIQPAPGDDIEANQASVGK